MQLHVMVSLSLECLCALGGGGGLTGHAGVATQPLSDWPSNAYVFNHGVGCAIFVGCICGPY